MILRMPDYCREFTCIAAKCKDNCCLAGWEIEIDSRSAEYYKGVGGDFGERLRQGMTDSSPACIIPNDNGRCPFLNGDNLCEIIINLGDERLCGICTLHPRFFRWFDGVKEGGIGLCCEEAARLILSRRGRFEVFEEDTDYEESDGYDEELFDFMLRTRERIFDCIYDERRSVSESVCAVLDYAERLQALADSGNYTLPEIAFIKGENSGDMRGILEFYMTLESLDKNWKPSIEKCIGEVENQRFLGVKQEKIFPEFEMCLRNLMGYFIWRYFLNGVFSEEFLSTVKLSAVSTAVIGFMFLCLSGETGDYKFEKFAEIAKDYSKEIEYSEENVEAILDASYENGSFATDRLKGLFQA